MSEEPFNFADYHQNLIRSIGERTGIREDILRSEIDRSSKSEVKLAWDQQRARIFRQRKALEPVVNKILTVFINDLAIPKRPRTSDMQTMVDDIHRVEALPLIRAAELFERAKRKVAITFRNEFDRMRMEALR